MLRPRLLLGAHHLAFLRATFQGLDARTAWRRYLAFVDDEGADLRRLEQRRTEMLTELLRMAEAAGATQAADHPVNQARALLSQDLSTRGKAQAPLVSPGRIQPAPAQALPSLDEFIEASGLDPDTYAESEWLALYRERYGLSQPVAMLPATAARPEPAAAMLDRRAVAERVRALGVLAALVRPTPRPHDGLGVWIAPPTQARLQAMGWRSIADLAGAVLRDGPAWWRNVPGLGVVRARALERWLAELHRGWQQPFPEAWFDPRERARRRWLGAASDDPLSARAQPGRRRDHWPCVLSSPHAAAPSGGSGTGAGGGAGASAVAGADEATTTLTIPGVDREAQQRIVQWLDRHRFPAATWRAYRKEAERLWWWCGLVRQCRVSELVESDLAAFEAFLRTPPADWTNRTPLPRTDPDWRPFRGGLGAASRAVALRIVRAFLSEAHPALDPGRLESPEARSFTGKRGQDAAPPSPAPATPSAKAAGTIAWPADASAAAGCEGIVSPLGSAAPPCTALAGAAGRRQSLLRALMRTADCGLAEALSLRFAAGTCTEAPALRWPDGRSTSVDPVLLALIRAHHRDAGLTMPGAGTVPVLLALRPGPRRWLAQGGQVALSAWPVPRTPRAWTLPAARRSVKRTGVDASEDVHAG